MHRDATGPSVTPPRKTFRADSFIDTIILCKNTIVELKKKGGGQFGQMRKCRKICGKSAGRRMEGLPEGPDSRPCSWHFLLISLSLMAASFSALPACLPVRLLHPATCNLPALPAFGRDVLPPVRFSTSRGFKYMTHDCKYNRLHRIIVSIKICSESFTRRGDTRAGGVPMHHSKQAAARLE